MYRERGLDEKRLVAPPQAVASGHAAYRPPVFGLSLSEATFEELADAVLGPPPARTIAIATANIQHIATMRRDPAFREAMAAFDHVTCDGFPVFRYARSRGYRVLRRTTGRDLVAAMMARTDWHPRHRPFFVVDGAETAEAARRWADARGWGAAAAVEIPPAGFIADDAWCAGLADRIRAHRATVLMLCVGAPRSEQFVHRQRDRLPPCWALCVGQALKVALGLVPQPPGPMVALDLEWLWRLALEPRRLAARYGWSAAQFVLATIEDIRARPLG